MANPESNLSNALTFTTNVDTSPWYIKDVAFALHPDARKMLETYTSVPGPEVISHITKTRTAAWHLSPYASVGNLTWLNPYILLQPSHPIILSKLKQGASILDCGCMIAPDLRQLAYEGAPTENMYGFDVDGAFFDIGFDFYRDRDRFCGTFFTADLSADLDGSELGEYRGKFDILWVAKLLHLWDRPNQIRLMVKLIELLKPVPGSMFVGSQNGSPQPYGTPLSVGTGGSASTWFSNAECIREDWAEVERLTGTKWEVEARLLDLKTIERHQNDGSEWNLQWAATLVGAAVKHGGNEGDDDGTL